MSRTSAILFMTAIASISFGAGTPVPLPSTGPTTYNVPSSITIAPDGSGTYKTIQDAIDALPAYPYETYDIHLLPGVYKEQVTIPRIKPHIHFRGGDAATTTISFGLGATIPGADGKPIGTFGTPTVRFLSDDVSCENITFENTFGNHGQALAIETAGDRIAFDHCRFLGWQDTIFADSNGRNYFHDCYIEGHVDFIFGKSTAVFDHCEIHSKAGGYLTAASTEPQIPFGYVFLDCKLTADASVKKGAVELGRPWRPYAATAYIRCDMGEQIKPDGWFNWKKPEREKTARYSEFGSTGPGGDMSHRVAWAHELTAEQAAAYTVPAILSGADGWKPFGYESSSQQSATAPADVH